MWERILLLPRVRTQGCLRLTSWGVTHWMTTRTRESACPDVQSPHCGEILNHRDQRFIRVRLRVWVLRILRGYTERRMLAPARRFSRTVAGVILCKRPRLPKTNTARAAFIFSLRPEVCRRANHWIAAQASRASLKIRVVGSAHHAVLSRFAELCEVSVNTGLKAINSLSLMACRHVVIRLFMISGVRQPHKCGRGSASSSVLALIPRWEARTG
jgi:hypothetical protein